MPMSKMVRSVVSTAALVVALGGCAGPADVSPSQAAENANKPGWTGRTFVAGSTSTIAGDAEATYQQQKWPVGRDR
jgi:ABC-type phosphate transport system substrate-binding protein